MEERVFEDEHGRKLIVRVNRSNIQIHTERKDLLDYRFYLDNIDLLKFLKERRRILSFKDILTIDLDITYFLIFVRFAEHL